jgi:hypothetical protein
VVGQPGCAIARANTPETQRGASVRSSRVGQSRPRQAQRGTTVKPNEQKSIGIVQIRSLRHLPAKHIDLPPEDQDFRLEIRPRFEK